MRRTLQHTLTARVIPITLRTRRHWCCSDESGTVPRYAFATDGIIAPNKDYILLSRQVGVPYVVVFLNKCIMVDDPG